MAIDEYRTIHITAAHANESIPPVRISAGDHDGRAILMELWDGASPVTGSAAEALSARLVFTTPDGTGSYVSMVRTASGGTVAFSCPVPSEMLGVDVGAFAVQVCDGADVVSTLRVPYLVDGALIDEDSPEAQDALSEFRDAVAKLDQLLPATTSRLGTIMVGGGLSADGSGVLSVDPSALPSAVPVAKGGTGKTTAKGGQYALLNDAAEQTAAASDDTYVLAAHTSASASNGFAAKRKLSNIWTYIAGKIRSVFGFSSSNVLPVANGGTGATSKSGAVTNIVDGSALAPASVAATGAVSGSSISDGTGTLAGLRDSVSQLTPSSFNKTLRGWGHTGDGGKQYNMYFPVMAIGYSTCVLSGTSITIAIRGSNTNTYTSFTVSADDLTFNGFNNNGIVVAIGYNADSSFSGGNNVPISVTLTGLRLAFS